MPYAYRRRRVAVILRPNAATFYFSPSNAVKKPQNDAERRFKNAKKQKNDAERRLENVKKQKTTPNDASKTSRNKKRRRTTRRKTSRNKKTATNDAAKNVKKQKTTPNDASKTPRNKKSGQWESNPQLQLGKLSCYRYTMAAQVEQNKEARSVPRSTHNVILP